MNEDSLRENNYARTTLDYGCVVIQDELRDYFMDEVGHAWKERFVIARNYDIAVYEAGIDTTDLEVTSEGFYLDLMMTRGSDPAESKSTLGADHLAVKEVKPRSSQVAGRHAVIAFTEEEEDPRIVWCVALVDSLNISTFSTLKKEAFRTMSKTMIVIYCYVNALSIMIASMGAGV